MAARSDFAKAFAVFAVFVLLPISAGTLVYVGWRPTSLLVFDWMEVMGIPRDVFRPAVNPPGPILYSFGDGAWVFAGTSWMLLIWQRLHPWVFVFFVLGLGGEVGQALGLVPGTFDWGDVASYIAAFVLACMGVRYAQTFVFDNRVADNGCSCSR